jgi:hypothetical protein
MKSRACLGEEEKKEQIQRTSLGEVEKVTGLSSVSMRLESWGRIMGAKSFVLDLELPSLISP